MVFALTELQRLAYQTAADRNPRDVLHFFLQSLIFSAVFSETFKSPKAVSLRSLFGTPYHSISVHMAEMYRIVSLRSIVTETSERIFNQLR